MQQKQLYCAKRAAVFLAVLLAFGAPARGADDLLNGAPPPPCQAGADYVAGQDAEGGAVAPADLTKAKVPAPDAAAVPLARGRQARNTSRRSRDFDDPGDGAPPVGADSPYVSLDGKMLDPLLNPAPCINQPGR